MDGGGAGYVLLAPAVLTQDVSKALPGVQLVDGADDPGLETCQGPFPPLLFPGDRRGRSTKPLGGTATVCTANIRVGRGPSNSRGCCEMPNASGGACWIPRSEGLARLA